MNHMAFSTANPDTHATPDQSTDKNSEQHNQILRSQAERWHIDELDKAIVSTCRKIDAATYELLVLLREFDERGGWIKWSSLSCSHWLAWRCDLSLCAAREKMRVAHALKLLPESSAAFASGYLSYSKARAITRVATAESEAGLLQLASKMTAAQLDQHCRQRRNSSGESLKEAKQAIDRRYLNSWRDERHGVVCVSIELPMEDGLLLEKALDKASAQSAESGPDDETDWSATQADALVLMAKEYLSGVSSSGKNQSSSTADHYQVMIHVDANALDGTGSGQSQLPIETVRRLCCDASVVPLIEDEAGQVLNVGRKQRIVTTAIRRALQARDGGCGYPGCSHTRFLDAHHIEHWADNGETSLDNTVLLCGAHHRMVHEGGFTIQRDHEGKLFFRRADGKAVPECGYHSDDWHDEFSAEVSVVETSAGVSGVREPQVSYLFESELSIGGAHKDITIPNVSPVELNSNTG